MRTAIASAPLRGSVPAMTLREPAPDGMPAPDDAQAAQAPLPAFAGVGIELEYMIVDRSTLGVRPIADALLQALSGRPFASDAARGALGVSNELVQHVVELKNVQPARSLASLREPLQALVGEVDRTLAPFAARLLPTGMHPWMDPGSETVLWPHAGAPIYRAYDRIFDCRRHGYANLQAMHVNLPFADDEEFERLHAAVRLVLPLVPALAASSPIAEERVADALDHRLQVYRANAVGFPSVTGRVVPDTVRTRAEYEARILAPMYREIAPADPDGLLQREWLNSRGAIARFDRHAIEIRLADAQECPYADLAIAAALVGLVRKLYEERHAPLARQQAIGTDDLVALLNATTRSADRAPIESADYRAVLGLPDASLTAGDAWRHFLQSRAGAATWAPAWRTLCERGPLARRIVAASGDTPTRPRLREIYGELADCLARGTMFDAA